MRKTTLLGALFTFVSPLTMAHSGHLAGSGFTSGMMHPFNGLDHLIVMVAVGILATMFTGSMRWKMPLSFAGVMVLGWLASMSGVIGIGVEIMIALSVIAMGGMLITGANIPKKIALGLIMLFAAFHGLAHGAEMPFDALAIYYGLGFVLSTSILHLMGIVLGESLIRISSNRHITNIIGALIAMLGGSLLLS